MTCFLKSPCFWVIFDHFRSFFPDWFFFLKNPANYIWAPNTMLSFRKKVMSQSGENLRTDGRTDGQTQLYRTLPAEARGPISSLAADAIATLDWTV